PTVHDVSTSIKNNLDYAEELARLQRQEYEAHSAATKPGFEFSVDTAAPLPQAEIEIRRNLVLAAGDPAGSIVSTGGIPASYVCASSVPTCGVLAGSIVSAGFGDPAATSPLFLVILWAPVNAVQDFPLHLTLEITNLRLAFSLLLFMMMIFVLMLQT
nr:hypothetical protein [Tanacetum cinerariifolium]